MIRTGMIRLGSALLILALIEAPSPGALIRHEFSSAFFADSGPSAWWDVARDAGPLAFDARGEFPGWPGSDSPREDEPDRASLLGPVHPGWSLDDPIPGPAHPARSASASREVAGPFPTPDDGPTAEPPLTLVGFLGAAAWTVYRRRAERRPAPPVRPRPAPARATATAIAPAARPAPTDRLPAPRPRTFAAPVVSSHRPLILPAKFVEVSATTLPTLRPAAGAAAVSVRRRGSVRRVPA